MMDLPCDSAAHAEEMRPSSCKIVELHVLYVPDDQWNVKLNKVPAEAIESFVSAGFIRVYPDVSLRAVRSELDVLLGAERSINRFSFLKCVGRSLALVKSKQEKDLKVKTFAPPYAPQPELYLLPVVENDSSVCSQSLTLETGSISPDHHKSYSLPAGTKEAVKFSHNPLSSQQPPPTSGLEEEEEERCSFSEEDIFSSKKSECVEQEVCSRKAKNLKVVQPDSQTKEKEENCRKKKLHKQNIVSGDSEKAESSEDRDSGSWVTDSLSKSRTTCTLKSIRNESKVEVTKNSAALSRPVQCSSPPAAEDDHKPADVQKNREELMAEIKVMREERKCLEWTRQELLRKGKDLLAQNRHCKNQARDSWKKKYFVTKKATAPLEDNLKHLQEGLETFYNKLLQQLHARDSRGKARQPWKSTKNELIIQIMTESHEIDSLKRKVEDAKMKLETEIKLRKQAATELRALKAELAQKRSQSSHLGPVASLSFVKNTRDKL
ncbi:spermatogenesis-associated protein 1 [Thalassophryne amazonica]|uniref:spermatogenesis-associated protein 1 n=1 Tax=Thalassophryne amazonica TaxID=390379 RepID=UPI001471587A|nr:spermatogenesis-associated protein 1 [Thalassophryne amazonica]